MNIAEAKGLCGTVDAYRDLSYVRQEWCEWIEHLETRAAISPVHTVRFI
jgi:hypothetical protein